MTTLRDKLYATGLQPHEFRVVRMFEDEGERVIVAYQDRGPTGGLMYVIHSYAGHECSRSEMEREVQALNDHINAHRRMLGLETDVFARNGIE